MEDFVLRGMVVVLNATLAREVVRSVRQPQRDELLLNTGASTLNVLLQRTQPHIYLLARPPREKDCNDSFGEALKETIAGQKLQQLEKRHADRVLTLVFSNASRLVLELVPVTANAFLLDAERRIIAQRSEDLVRSRRQNIGDIYQFPPVPQRLPWDVAAAQSAALQNERDLIERMEGFGPLLAREVCQCCKGDAAQLQSVLERVAKELEGPIHWYCYLSSRVDSNDLREFDFFRDCLLSPLRLESRRGDLEKQFENLQAASDFLRSLEKEWAEFHRRRSELLHGLEQTGKKQIRLQKNLREQLKEARRADTFKRYGELLKIGASAWKHRDLPEAIEAEDLFEPGQPLVLIPLPRRESLRENIDFYFQRAKRLERSCAGIEAKLSQLEKEDALLDERLKKVKAARNLPDLPIIKAPQSKKRAVPSAGSRPFRRYVSSDGLAILVGKNDRENEELTFREAQSRDVWLHAADYPGSHVVVKLENRPDIPPATLVEAAQLAAFYSKAKNLKKAAVHYARKKYVFKIKGAASGLVRLAEFKTIMVEPKRQI